MWKDYYFFIQSYKKRHHGKHYVINEISYRWYGKYTSANVHPDGWLQNDLTKKSQIIFQLSLNSGSTKPELRFCAGSNPAHGVSEIRDGEDLWQCSLLEIRINAFRRSTIPQKQFIIIIIIIIINNRYPAWQKKCVEKPIRFPQLQYELGLNDHQSCARIMSHETY